MRGTSAIFNAPVITPEIFPFDAALRMLNPFDNNLLVVLSITPLLVRVESNLFALESVFPGRDDEETLICLVKLFAPVFDSKPTAANPLVTADKLGVFPCSIVFA